MDFAARVPCHHQVAELDVNLSQDFDAMNIRCRSTSFSAPEMDCPSMTFSTSSSTNTETENETPPSSPPSSTQTTPLLKVAFDEDEHGFPKQKASRKHVGNSAPRVRTAHPALEEGVEDWGGYEAESECIGAQGKKTPTPTIGSPREHKFGVKNTRERVRQAKLQQLAKEPQSNHHVSCAMSSTDGILPTPRSSMRFRNRKPVGLSIVVPDAESTSDPDSDEMETPVRSKTAKDATKAANTRDVLEMTPGSPHQGLHSVHAFPDCEDQTLLPAATRLHPLICDDDELSPIESLPSPLVFQGNLMHEGCRPSVQTD